MRRPIQNFWALNKSFHQCTEKKREREMPNSILHRVSRMDAIRDWAGLPSHIVDLLVIKLDRFFDYVRFCSVCQGWRYVALEANVDHKGNFDVLKASRKKLPMLMLDTEENNDAQRGLFCVSDGKTYTINLPIPYKYKFVGSSLGWLLCVDETMVVTLVNPFNNGCIVLPVFKNPRRLFRVWYRRFFSYYITKGILLSDPQASPASFGVVVLYTCMGKLAYFESGKLFWKFIHSPFQLTDIIYYKDKLYGVSNWGHFVHIDLYSGTTKIIIRGSEAVPVHVIYLVESQDGDLLLVKRVWYRRTENGYHVEDPISHDVDGNAETRHFDDVENDDDESYDTDDNPYLDTSSDSETESLETSNPLSSNDYRLEGCPGKSLGFKVFKMTQSKDEEPPTWVEINNIGEQALFLGDNQSVSVSSTDFSGCVPNSIYFTTQHHNILPPYVCYGLDDDSGIFNLGNGRIYSHHMLGSSYKYEHPPTWFVPNPQEID